MALVEPVPPFPAATATIGTETALVIADYHAGIETAIRNERGVEVKDRSGERLDRLRTALDRTGVDRLVVLGDLMHSIGGPKRAEREELERVLSTLSDFDVTLVKGNHDGDIEDWTESMTVTGTEGIRLGDIGFVHGHTWPAMEVLEADVVCIGHEHPQVRLEDDVGGSRVERIWLRGRLRRYPFAQQHEDLDWRRPEIVVFPAFNELAGGTWVNVEGQSFLAPFFPQGLDEAQAYLLDGTRLGGYREV